MCKKDARTGKKLARPLDPYYCYHEEKCECSHMKIHGHMHGTALLILYVGHMIVMGSMILIILGKDEDGVSFPINKHHMLRG